MSRKHLWFQFGMLGLGSLLLGGWATTGCLDDPAMTMGRCEDDGNPCTDSDCTSGVTKHEPVPDHTACALGVNEGRCMAGACVLDCASAPTTCRCVTDAECPNSADCKIFSCIAGQCTNPGQKACRGAPCTSEANCASGFCRDGVCCESGCNDLCKSCAITGKQGHCEFVPIYSDDDSYVNAAQICSVANNLTCDGKGGCLMLTGSQCVANEDCISQICTQLQFPGAPYCRPAAAGAPCTSDEQCQSKSCVNGKCGAAP